MGAEKNKLFFPEHLTPLYYSTIYNNLSYEQKYDYNRLFAISANETIMFFEDTLAHNIFGKLKKQKIFADVKEELGIIEKQEAAHSLMFRQYNVKNFPEYYQNGNSNYFFYQPKLFLKLWNFSSSHAHYFSLFYWLVFIQEEKMLNYGNEFEIDGDLYNEEYRKLHLNHMKEEQSHAEMDHIIVNRIWNNTSKWNKSINGFLFYHLYTQIFLAPKRTALRVVDEWLKLHPELKMARTQIRKEFFHLDANKKYLEMQLGEKYIPKMRHLIKDKKEFSFFNRLCCNQ